MHLLKNINFQKMAKTGLNIEIKIFNKMLSKNKKIIKIVIFLRKNYFIIKNIFLMMCLLKTGGRRIIWEIS